MSGELDLQSMLRSFTVIRRPGRFTITTSGDPVSLGVGVVAVLEESEGITVVSTVEEAKRRGWPVTFEAAWLIVEVHSSLEAVGLTAAFARALADAGIACNVLAGFYHDHILVPIDRADDAERCLAGLRT